MNLLGLWKRKAQCNKYARIWACIAFVFFGFATYFLIQLRCFNRINSDLDDPKHHPKTKVILALIFLLVVEGAMFVLHMFLLCRPIQLRRLRFIRTVPTPFVIAIGCVATSYIPLACTIEGSLADENLDIFSLGAIICFSFDLLCIQMVLMPAYDYMWVHMSLSITATVVLSLTRDGSPLRRLWVLVAGLLTLIVLTFHHWITAPASIVDVGTTEIIDARIGGVVEHAIVIPPEEGNEADEAAGPTFFGLLQEWCNSPCDGALEVLLGILVLVALIELFLSFWQL